MSIWWLLIAVLVAGALGGVIDALLTDNGFLLPEKAQTADGKGRIWRPGFLANSMIGVEEEAAVADQSLNGT